MVDDRLREATRQASKMMDVIESTTVTKKYVEVQGKVGEDRTIVRYYNNGHTAVIQ